MSWFTVLDVFSIKGRGTVVTGTFDEPTTPAATGLLESPHGHEWVVTGVERFCCFQGKPTKDGEPVGLLVPNAPPAAFKKGASFLYKAST